MQNAYWLAELRAEFEATGSEWDKAEQGRRMKQAIWLACYVRRGGKTIANGAAHTSGATSNRWISEDPIFQPCWDRAQAAFNEILIGECRRRAVEGVMVTKRDSAGNVVSEERKFSDALLIHLMKGMDPEKRWALRAELSGAQEETWRRQMMKLMDDPALLAKLDDVAHALLGEQPEDDAGA